MTKWLLTHEGDTKAGYTLISTHSTLQAAQGAFRRRNPHWNKRYAITHGMQTTGTFDHIRRMEDGIVDTSADYAPEKNRQRKVLQSNQNGFKLGNVPEITKY